MKNDLVRRRNQSRFSLAGYFENAIIGQKLNNVTGYFLIAAVAMMFGYLLSRQTILGFGLFGAILAFFTIVACIVNTEIGLYINIAYAFFAFHISRYLFNDTFPVGVVTDILIGATFLSLLIKGTDLKKSFNQFSRTSVGIGILVLLFYLLIELFNPFGQSFEGWLQSFRRFFVSILLLYVSFNVFKSHDKIKRFIIVLFVLCVLVGLYACIQQVHGLFDFEIAWVTATENRFGLIYINGNFRKFSTMSDPTAFGVLMAACALFFSILAMNRKKLLHRLILVGGILIMLLGMAYSGTRTANVMIAAGVVMFILLSFNKKSTRVFAFIAGAIFLGLLYVPIYGNETINRFRSSFVGSEDASFQVRELNRAYIQPYIHKHPLGGGLGTAGAGGLMYSPGHYLAGFPPDSGYLKKALETGWIGLGIICILYFTILKSAISGYFRSKNETSKWIFAAIVAFLFSFYVAEFAQEAIGQITDLVVYYPIIAIMLRLKLLNEDTPLLNEQELIVPE